MKEDIAPVRGKTTDKTPWEGKCAVKPWDYKITAVIPVLDTPETVEICVDLLRLQTEQPYILIIDTGSQGNALERIQKLHTDDTEVHFLRLNAVQHPSDFPAIAMDLAFSLCRTEFIFATHADCFLRKRTFLEELLSMSQSISPVVGYEISPRKHKDWQGMVSHTATMYHMPTMDKIGFGWSLRRLCNLHNVGDCKPNAKRPNWPDTEILGNYILREQGIAPHLIGHEKNFSRQIDDNIDHFRSYTSSKLYNSDYYKQAKEWFEDARIEAIERIKAWRIDNV